MTGLIRDDRLETARAKLVSRGQEHVLRWWDELDCGQREELLCDIESVPWSAIDPIMESHILRAPRHPGHQNLQPATIHPASPPAELRNEYVEAQRHGEELIRGGAVAAFTVAGGQGSRLGVEGPKGMVRVTPVMNKSLFQLFAEMILAAGKRYHAAIPWYIMTSPANHQATEACFHQNDFFGLPPRDIVFFPQGTLPAFDVHGKLLLDQKHRLSLAPDGHGGSLKALVRSGAIADMRARGIAMISYFQVDNPLVRPVDPLFVGLHARTRSEMSTKVARKAHDSEKVGNVCREGGRVKVIEYSEMPQAMALARNPDGSRRFDAANLAMHLLSVDFVDRVAGTLTGLPLRRAEKAIPFVDAGGRRVTPREPNAVKLETFVFDVLPLAEHPLVLEVDRAEEFSPVKNASGPDSLETSRRDQIARASRWLEAAGVAVPRRPDGTPDVEVEISPLFALDAEELKFKKAQIPAMQPGREYYLNDMSNEWFRDP